MQSLLEMREKFNKDGFTFYIHVDAAWGGYFASVLHSKDGNLIPLVQHSLFFAVLFDVRERDYFKKGQHLTCKTWESDIMIITS
jgi:hypothetical protein